MRQLDYIAHLELYKMYDGQTLHVETKDICCKGYTFDADYDIIEFHISMREPRLDHDKFSMKIKANICDDNNQFIMYTSTEGKPKWKDDIAHFIFKVLVLKKEIKDED